MIKLKNIVTVFLKNNNDYLLMKRADNRKIAPGFWNGISGHMEPWEINDPYRTCLREVQEESGIQEKDIKELSLKYIILRKSKDEMVVNYFHFGKTQRREVSASEEGTLHWVPESEVLKRKHVDVIRLTLEHYLETGDGAEDIMFGTVKEKDGQPFMEWLMLHDWQE